MLAGRIGGLRYGVRFLIGSGEKGEAGHFIPSTPFPWKGHARRAGGWPKAKESEANLRRYAPPPSKGRRENAAFPASSFRAEARNLFRSRSGKSCEGSGERETPCASCDWGSRCFMQMDLRRKTANGKRKRSLGCARDDETRKRFLPTPFSIRSGSQPPALRATSFQRKEGEKVKNLSLLSLSGAVLYSYAAPCRCPFNAPQIFVFQRSPL